MDEYLLIVKMGHRPGSVLLCGGFADSAFAINRNFSSHFYTLLFEFMNFQHYSYGAFTAFSLLDTGLAFA
ncbi:MAG: hypothetical protein P4N41_16780 [Negativicutes bacterium]|nr:hypothetical protein [Negativicutes bacterium]